MEEKTYKVVFSTDYKEMAEWCEKSHFANDYGSNFHEIAICNKYRGKTIKLSDIPEFVKEVGHCIIDNDTIEIYNDYRE